MIFPVLLLAAVAANYLLFVWIRQLFLKTHAWRRIATIAGTVAVVRAAAVGAGAWVLANDSSWIQIPAYLFINLGLPEIVLAGRQSPASPESWYGRAMGIVALGSVVWVLGVAAGARASSAASKRKLDADTG